MTAKLGVTKSRAYRARFWDEDGHEITGVTNLVWSSLVDGDITFSGQVGQTVIATGVNVGMGDGLKVHEPLTSVEGTLAVEVAPVVQTIFRATIEEA